MKRNPFLKKKVLIKVPKPMKKTFCTRISRNLRTAVCAGTALYAESQGVEIQACCLSLNVFIII